MKRSRRRTAISEADLFYADLMGIRRRRRVRAPIVPDVWIETEDALEGSLGAGEVFDRIVHRGMSPEAVLGAERADGESWEIAAAPHSAPPIGDLKPGSLVVQRALGEERLGSMKVLGEDIEAHELYGEDGLIRADILVLEARTPQPSTSGTFESAYDTVAEVDAPTVSAVTVPSATGLGTSKTVAPIADLSPQVQMNELIDRELTLIARARIVAEWIDKKFSATIDQAVADSELMRRLDVSKDKTLLEKFRPFPGMKLPEVKTDKGTKKRTQLFTTDAVLTELRKPQTDAAGLLQVFELLRHYGVVLLPPGNVPGARKVIASVTRVEARLERGRFDTETKAVEARAVEFKRGVANFGIVHNCVEGELIPDDIWSDKKHKPLAVAKPVLSLLRRLRKLNSGWSAGTYPSHFWNDFSVDMFIAASIRSDGFWNHDKMRAFFKALSAACEDEAAPGRFAWKAIYNDEALAQEMNALYGAGRVLFKVAGHGPGDGMHVHLDVRPLTVPFDATTGFWIKNGRVVLQPPA